MQPCSRDSRGSFDPPRRCRAGGLVALALCLPLGASAAAGQEILAVRACTGVGEASGISGLLQLERWITSAPFRYYGRFQDAAGNLHELEVRTADTGGGVGSVWTNGMRHRETHVHLAVAADTAFVLRSEDGAVVSYRCTRPPG